MQMPDQITLVKTIAERLKYARELLDPVPSQGELAKLANVSQGTIGNIEAGTRRNPRELLAIACAVGVNPQWLKTGEGPMLPAGSAATAHASSAQQHVGLDQALPVVLKAIGGLTAGQWNMVRARLDDMPGHPEAREDVADDVLPLLQAPQTKPRSVGA